MKHGWLYLHQLDTFAALEKLVAFYVEQHNTVVQDPPGLPDPSANSRMLHLHDEMSGMP